MKFILILIPVIGGVTGWIILSAALKVMFKPYQPVRVSWSNMYFQGLIPKKQAQMALSIREVVEAQLLGAVTKDSGLAPEIFNRLTNTIAQGIRERTEQKIPGFLPKAVRVRIVDAVEDIVLKEAPGLIEAVLDNIRRNKGSDEDLCRVLEDKIKTFDIRELEHTIMQSREVLYLKSGGAVIGLAAGLLQLLIVWISLT